MVTPDPVVPHAISDDDSDYRYLPCVGCVGSRAQLKVVHAARAAQALRSSPAGFAGGARIIYANLSPTSRSAPNKESINLSQGTIPALPNWRTTGPLGAAPHSCSCL